MTARSTFLRVLAALGLGLALLLAGGAPVVEAAEATAAVTEAPLTAGEAAVRRRRPALRTRLRARPVRPARRSRAVHVVRLRPAAGHEAPRRAPPTLLI